MTTTTTTTTNKSRRRPTGHIIYHGPSLIDGKPIVVVATSKSTNSKTGNMLQTWIIRADVDPVTASRTGEDYAICGRCPHRGKARPDATTGWAADRTCYVNLLFAPRGIFKAFQEGKYPTAAGHSAIAALGAGRMVRLGSYGDPAAVPGYIWDSLCSEAKGRTGYTHQSGVEGADVRPDLCMVSADSLAEAEAAWAFGQRTFRVIADVADVAKGREVLCPASEEAGRRTECARCGLCAGNGTSAKSIAIVAHGSSASKAKALVAAR